MDPKLAKGYASFALLPQSSIDTCLSGCKYLMRCCCAENFLLGDQNFLEMKLITEVGLRLHLRGCWQCETAPASLLLWGNAVNCVDASSRRWRRPCKWPCLLCRNLQCKPFQSLSFFCKRLTAADLELAGVSVQRVVVEVHPTGDCDPHTESCTL